MKTASPNEAKRRLILQLAHATSLATSTSFLHAALAALHLKNPKRDSFRVYRGRAYST